MHCTLICTTYNRNTYLTRILRSFLEQDYKDMCTLLIFNSGKETALENIELPDNKKIILINKTTFSNTNKEYSCIGEKYIDALSLVPKCNIITSYDCDDIFLPNHVSEGVKGMIKAYNNNKLAYKPKYSFFKSAQEIIKQENVFEPSIFVDYNWIKEQQYYKVNVKYHDKWLLPLIYENKILVDREGISTFCYDWSGEIPVYKMSGKKDDNLNFILSQSTESDTGNGITIAMSKEKYCNYIKDIYV